MEIPGKGGSGWSPRAAQRLQGLWQFRAGQREEPAPVSPTGHPRTPGGAETLAHPPSPGGPIPHHRERVQDPWGSSQGMRAAPGRGEPDRILLPVSSCPSHSPAHPVPHTGTESHREPPRFSPAAPHFPLLAFPRPCHSRCHRGSLPRGARGHLACGSVCVIRLYFFFLFFLHEDLSISTSSHHRPLPHHGGCSSNSHQTPFHPFLTPAGSTGSFSCCFSRVQGQHTGFSGWAGWDGAEPSWEFAGQGAESAGAPGAPAGALRQIHPGLLGGIFLICIWLFGPFWEGIGEGVGVGDPRERPLLLCTTGAPLHT